MINGQLHKEGLIGRNGNAVSVSKEGLLMEESPLRMENVRIIALVMVLVGQRKPTLRMESIADLARQLA